MRFTTAFTGASTLALALALAAPVFAQDAANPASPNAGPRMPPTAPSPVTPGPAGPAAREPRPVGEPDSGAPVIVVTAQKRSQNLQDVPIVVTTVNKQLLQDTGIKDIKDLTVLTPGLLVTSTTSEGSTTARIRGIGTVGDNPGLESSVGVVIDGVYRPRNGVGFGDLGDVEQIEVLKGPQGTLFGKSTSAGVINIVTASPSFNFGANAEFTAGNYGQYGGSAEVTGPLIADKLAGSLYIADRQRDGFFDVDTGQGPRTKDYDTDRNFYTIRGQLLAKPIDNLTMRLIADYSHRQEVCCIAVETREGESNAIINALAGGVGEGDGSNPYARNAYSNRPDGSNVTDGGVSLQADYKLPSIDATLTSITAWRQWKQVAGFDADFSTADLLYLPSDDTNSNEFRQLSQEVRFAGAYGKLDYLVGVFYAHEDLRSNQSILFGNQFGSYLSLLFSGGASPLFLRGSPFSLFTPGGANYVGGDGSQDRYRQANDSYSVFTNNTYHITNKLEANIGLRYTLDDKTLNNVDTNIGGGAACLALAKVGLFYNSLPAGSAAKAQLAPIAQIIEPAGCLPFESPGFNGFSNHQHESESVVTGTGKLTYRFDPRLLVYGSYARGFKAGGFNLDRTQCEIGVDAGCNPGTLATITPLKSTEFGGEYVQSFELGEKATLLNRKLLLNAALFYQDFTNFQLNTFNGLVFVVDSVPEITSKGLDTDFYWFPIHNLSFQGGLTVADTRYDLTSAELASLVARTGFQGSRGSRLSLAPLYSASLAGTYTYDLNADYKLRFNAGFKFNSNYNTGSDLDPDKEQKDYWLMDARIVLAPRTDRWSVEVWAENLFDRDYKQIAFDSGYQNVPTNSTGVLDAFLGAPRTFGVTIRGRY
ncbi:MAG: TonB-dependent receptor [Caulobacteraceae bacterium]|nr:TonB-dependent receptor [Caulobacter sp.]